jgi:signal transduction histidine kinase
MAGRLRTYSMFEFFANLFNTDGFMPRRLCGEWTDAHRWLHVASDIAIFGAYVAIPCVLAFFIVRRRDVPFPRILWLFVAFIFSCGFVHLIESFMFWQPVYRLSGLVKFITAVVSWLTVFALIRIVPMALHLPGLARFNTELRDEVEERKRVEGALRESEVKMATLLESERAARSDAEQANRIKDEFLSTVSHELRTPLNAILGYSQLLQRGRMTDDEFDEGLSVIERNAKAQAQIIEDLLDMSRIMSGKVRLDVTAVDLDQVIAASIATVKPAADARNIRIQTILDPRASTVLGDRGRLQQVIWNLLTNAIKFTPKEGRVQIVLERVNSHAEIRVSDSGQGIAPDFLPYIFDRFRQADATVTRRQGGLGLGLSIAKQLVELHGGSISATSPGPGQGAMFVINLPIQPVQAVEAIGQNPKTVRQETPPLSLSGVRVLVVDDDEDSRNLVKRLLEDYGAQVLLAASVDIALSLFASQRPDVILSDIGMPERDGYDLLRNIRSLSVEEGRNVPAAEDRKRAMLAGYQSHITKPVDPGELVAVVATLTGRTGR